MPLGTWDSLVGSFRHVAKSAAVSAKRWSPPYSRFRSRRDSGIAFGVPSKICELVFRDSCCARLTAVDNFTKRSYSLCYLEWCEHRIIGSIWDIPVKARCLWSAASIRPLCSRVSIFSPLLVQYRLICTPNKGTCQGFLLTYPFFVGTNKVCRNHLAGRRKQ